MLGCPIFVGDYENGYFVGVFFGGKASPLFGFKGGFVVYGIARHS